jgi:hypothetical protein
LTRSLVWVIDGAVRFKTVILQPPTKHLHGATLAQDHLALCLDELTIPSTEPIVFQVDFQNTLSVTASYLRATVHWAFLCGQAMASGTANGGPTDRYAIRPLPIFPVVTGCSREIAADVDEFFRGRNLAILFSEKPIRSEFNAALVLGSIEPLLAGTLQKLCMAGEGTAASLAADSTENISVNGWSNRLADLHLLRLVSRRRDGKFWIYSPLSKAIKLWA